MRGSTGCNCRHETRRLASYDAGQEEYRCCAELPCGKSGFSISYRPRSGFGISCALGGMAGLTIADSGPGSLLPPHALNTSAAHTTAASARVLHDHNIVTASDRTRRHVRRRGPAAARADGRRQGCFSQYTPMARASGPIFRGLSGACIRPGRATNWRSAAYHARSGDAPPQLSGGAVR